MRKKHQITGKITSNSLKKQDQKTNFQPKFTVSKHQLTNVSQLNPLTGEDAYKNLREQPLKETTSFLVNEEKNHKEYTIGKGRENIILVIYIIQ